MSSVYDKWRARYPGPFYPFRGGEVGAERAMEKYEIKSGGERQTFDSGMQRDVDATKVRDDLVYDGPLLERYAAHLTAGAQKYSPRNWMKANSIDEMERFRESASRHFKKWMRGDRDEDHMAAVVFNLNGYEYVRDRLLSDPMLDEDMRASVRRGGPLR